MTPASLYRYEAACWVDPFQIAAARILEVFSRVTAGRSSFPSVCHLGECARIDPKRSKQTSQVSRRALYGAHCDIPPPQPRPRRVILAHGILEQLHGGEDIDRSIMEGFPDMMEEEGRLALSFLPVDLELETPCRNAQVGGHGRIATMLTVSARSC